MFHDFWTRRLSWLGSVALVLLSGAMLKAQELRDFDVDLDVLVAEAGSGYWLGLICDSPDATLRSQLKLKDTGLVVREVVGDAPAAKAGLKVHDVLLTAGDKPLSDIRQLIEVVDKSEGKELAIEVVREGAKTTIKVTPGKRPERTGKMPEDMRLWLERRGGGDGTWTWKDIRPGAVTKRVEVRRGTPKLPKDMTVIIHKEGEKPAKITVQQGDKKFEVTEDKLSELPEDVRKHVQPLVRPGTAIFTPGGFDTEVFKFREGFPGTPGLPGLPGDSKRLEKRVDELNKQIDQLRKSLEELSKEKTKP